MQFQKYKAMGEVKIAINNLTKKYGSKIILDDINLEIDNGDYVSITGCSGAGKSTLINIIGLLDLDYDGKYYFDGNIITKKNAPKYLGKEIGFVFQQFQLLPGLSAFDNVLLPYVYANFNDKLIKQKCLSLFEKIGLSGKENQLVNTMSGGEKQRVALIRSILLDPGVIIADEPTGNLDPGNAQLVQKFLEEMNGLGKTVIVVTHDMTFAGKAKKRYRIESGKIQLDK